MINEIFYTVGFLTKSSKSSVYFILRKYISIWPYHISSANSHIQQVATVLDVQVQSVRFGPSLNSINMTPYSFEDWFTKHFQYTVFSDLQSSAREDGMNFCYHFREKVKKPHTVTKTLRHWVTYREVYESERIHP